LKCTLIGNGYPKSLKQAAELFKTYAKVHWFPDKLAEKSVELDVCVTCAKNVTDDAIKCFWCKEWEHRSYANIKTNEYVLLNGASNNILFFAALACHSYLLL